ncbi:MAG: ATP-dependent helicase [Candidatus Eremiobacteraeota bacterium]|nr:ATP-dependent helicase [Candidatus Eremiobacteraeota bacterium]
MTFDLDQDQRAAVEALVEQLIMICGPAGAGKTQALLARAERIEGTLLSASQASELPGVETLALNVLQSSADSDPFELIDDIEASIIFEQAAEPLFALEWAEVIQAEIDPELAGLRAPQRFLENAFRLIQHLRDSCIDPEQFLAIALKGATSFYAQPPNLAHPELLYYTKDEYRGSLQADRAELQRQYRREVDLAKVLHKVYQAYLELLTQRRVLTAADAIAEATRRLKATQPTAQRRPLLIDDAQELKWNEISFLQALHGDALTGVTLCADRESTLGLFAGARPDRVFALNAQRTELSTQYRTPAMVERAARHVSAAADSRPLPAQRGAATIYRGTTRGDEAAFIASYVDELLRSGAATTDIVVIFRSVTNVLEYEDALLNKGIDVQVAGDLNIFHAPDVLDALALLWNVHDPFAHEWLLRTLCGPACNLSDATLIALCSEPGTPQTALFDTEEVPPEADPQPESGRKLRLGWNVVRGDQDAALMPLARERVREFRALRERWLHDMRALPLPDLARKIFAEGLAARGKPGSVRERSQQRNIQRLLRRIDTYADRYPAASLPEFLAYAQLRAESTLEGCEEERNDGAVRMLSIGSVAGREFDHVIIGNVRAGSFPRYYVPDAFMFSPTLGMIAKENVGDARAARTAKFTYYMFQKKTRDRYNKEERRAFAYALRRARRTALVTASGRATRGMTTPEFLNELQAAGIPEASVRGALIRSATS